MLKDFVTWLSRVIWGSRRITPPEPPHFVGVQRFELWTSSTPLKRATGLRHTPSGGHYSPLSLGIQAGGFFKGKWFRNWKKRALGGRKSPFEHCHCRFAGSRPFGDCFEKCGREGKASSRPHFSRNDRAELLGGGCFYRFPRGQSNLQICEPWRDERLRRAAGCSDGCAAIESSRPPSGIGSQADLARRSLCTGLRVSCGTVPHARAGRSSTSTSCGSAGREPGALPRS